MSNEYQLLLSETARLYERHEADRSEPFNLFSVLRSDSDEVNLHSKFLAAVLNYRKSREGKRENLADFLSMVGKLESFGLNGVDVVRERYNIDILITNTDKEAIVIENKIFAKDQPKQMQRYHRELIQRGYGADHISMLYITLFGDDPSEDSRGQIAYNKLAYNDGSFQNWLRNCQKRAYDEPALRESIGQYRQVVRKLTGRDFSEAYMSELQELCKRHVNLMLVHDLGEASNNVLVSFYRELLETIEQGLKSKFDDLPEKRVDWKQLDDKIRHFVTATRVTGLPSLGFRLTNAVSVCVWLEREGVSFGVACHKPTHPEIYEKIRVALKKVLSRSPNEWCPWWNYASSPIGNFKNPGREEIGILANAKTRTEVFTEIAVSITDGLNPVWVTIRNGNFDKSTAT